MTDRTRLVGADTLTGARPQDPHRTEAPAPPASTGKLLLRVEEVAQLLDVGRTRVYDLMRTGELRSVKIGGSRRVPSTAVEDYLERLLDGVP